jgi:hypothetical protein
MTLLSLTEKLDAEINTYLSNIIKMDGISMSGSIRVNETIIIKNNTLFGSSIFDLIITNNLTEFNLSIDIHGKGNGSEFYISSEDVLVGKEKTLIPIYINGTIDNNQIEGWNEYIEQVQICLINDCLKWPEMPEMEVFGGVLIMFGGIFKKFFSVQEIFEIVKFL